MKKKMMQAKKSDPAVVSDCANPKQSTQHSKKDSTLYLRNRAQESMGSKQGENPDDIGGGGLILLFLG